MFNFSNNHLNRVTFIWLVLFSAILLIASGCSTKNKKIDEVPDLQVGDVVFTESDKSISGMPEDSTYTFNPGDDGVVANLLYSNLSEAHDVKIRWYRPDGKVYSASRGILEPSEEGKYIKKGVARHKMGIKGEEASEYPGKWKLRAYLDGKEVAESSFRIKSANEKGNLPPYLKIEQITLSKNVLRANDRAMLKVRLKNTGMGDARDAYIRLSSSTSHIHFKQKHPVPTIFKEGGEKTVKIPIEADRKIPTGDAFLDLKVVVPNFDIKVQGKRLSFQTRKFRNPELKLAKFTAMEGRSSDGNNQIEKNEMINLKLAVQNMGKGEARDVNLELSNPQSGVQFLGMSPQKELNYQNLQQKKRVSFNKIPAGDYKILNCLFFVTSSFQGESLDFNIQGTEEFDQYGFSEAKEVDINTELKAEGKIRKVSVPDKEIEDKEVKVMDLPDFKVDVDTRIPETKMNKPDAVAVVIGNRNYESKDVPNVKYATHDAQVMKRYLIKTLGYKERNIIFKTDITKSEFNSLFGIKGNPEGQLHNYIKPGKSDVFVYYSGHGAPDPDSKKGFFVPVECNPTNISLNGYPLKVFYSNLAKLKADNMTIVLDSCFSGGTNKGSTLIKSASPIGIEVKNRVLSEQNAIYLASAQGNQISSWYPDKKHSLFTYFFLKAMQGEADLNNDNRLTYKEIYEYVADRQDGVPYWARRLYNGREQIPTLQGQNQEKTFVRYE